MTRHSRHRLAVATLAATLLTAAPAAAGEPTAPRPSDHSPDPHGLSGAGGWDYQGSDVFTSESKEFKSGGGNFMVCLSGDSKHGNYRLYESDNWALDDVVSYPISYPSFPWDFTDNCLVYRNISNYVDGDNGQAELYLVKWTGGNSTVYAYD